MEINDITGQIVDAAIRVHSDLGPGLLESVYEACLAHELRKRKLIVENQVTVPVVYEGTTIDTGLRFDLLVEQQVLVELKSVDALLPIHDAQVMTYLRLTGVKIGLLINFNVVRLKDGLKRIVQGYVDPVRVG